MTSMAVAVPDSFATTASPGAARSVRACGQERSADERIRRARERAAAWTAAGVTGYQRRLLAAVTASTFFAGFDQAILALAAPYVARDFGLGPDGLGLMLSLIGVGAVLALLITAQADRYGRRRLLLITVAGYGICTGLTALAQRPPDFVLWQLLARMFLFAELALAIVVLAEESPPARRGFAVSLLMAANVAGGAAAAFTLGPLSGAGYGWRAMYALGLIALPLVFILRLGIRETTHFAALDRARPAARIGWAPLAIWQEPHRRSLVLCVLLFGLIGALVSTFPSFYAYFLVNERAFAPAQVSTTFGLALLMGDSGHTAVRLAARPLGTARRRRHRAAARRRRGSDRVQRRRVTRPRSRWPECSVCSSGRRSCRSSWSTFPSSSRRRSGRSPPAGSATAPAARW